jgi:hypothetical protein
MEAPPATDTEGLPGAAIPWRRRALFIGSVVSVAALGMWVNRWSVGSWCLALAAVALGVLAARRATGLERMLGWGGAVVLAAAAPNGTAGRAPDVYMAFVGVAGALACTVAAAFAVPRASRSGGIVPMVRTSPRVTAGAIVLLWGASLLPHVVPSGRAPWLAESARAWVAIAAAASLLCLWAEAERTFRRRRLELGIPERIRAIRALLAVAMTFVIVAAAPSDASVDATGELACVLVSWVLAWVALHPDPAKVERVALRAVVLALPGTLLAAVAAAVAGGGGDDAREVTLLAVSAALGLGALVVATERPLGLSGGPWADAFQRAAKAATLPEPDDAIRDVLIALRGPGGLSSPSPELWTLHPARSTKVDPAGYVHDRDADLPDGLVAIALREPEGTLRADVLEALEVRRPDLRGLSRWMSDRGAATATIVSGGADAEGLLVFPRTPRGAPESLDDVRALKVVADRLAAACQARATRARLLARAHEADVRAEAAGERIERLLHEQALRAERDAQAATRLVRPATAGVYSAGSRGALEALERRTSAAAPIAVVAPSGVDPVPHLARAHLAGVRHRAALVLVDATSAREHDIARWDDPRVSPLALADGGMLVLLDGAALPVDVQQRIARALAERKAPWTRPEPLDVQLALTAVVSPEQLVAEGRLDPSLALRLGDACGSPIVLPRLRERVEDLRTIVTDRLAREGLRVFGRPVGIEHAAYARLVEHPFPGEEAELAVVIQRLVARCAGDVVRAADVDALHPSGPAPGQARDPAAARRKGPVSV